jgi:hypothetical protein
MFHRNVELLTGASGEEGLECIRRSERTFELRILAKTVPCMIQKNREIKEKKEGEGGYKTTKMSKEKKIK